MNEDYENKAKEILSLNLNWKNRDDNFKELSIEIMSNTLKYLKNQNINSKEDYQSLRKSLTSFPSLS